MKLLIIEDDINFAKALVEFFAKEHYQTEHVSDAKSALRAITSSTYDVILCDLLLPDKSGQEICKHLQSLKNQVPIIIISALSEVDTKIKLFESGADDYLSKPFEFKELLARIKMLVQKRRTIVDSVLTYQDLKLDMSKRTTVRSDVNIALREKETKILEYFMRHPEQVLTREMILKYVWGSSVDRYSNVVDVHVHNLRAKIDKPYPKKLIKTVSNVGYKISK